MGIKLSHASVVYFVLLVCIIPTTVVSRVKNTLDEAIETRLKQLNKPAIKTIQSSDGDVVDCVAFNLQPAFDHPTLKGQKQLGPPEIPKELATTNKSSSELVQTWMESGEFCPQGSIPILRTTKEDLLRSKSFETYGQKIMIGPTSVDGYIHEHSIGRIDGSTYYGGKADFNVWQPYVASPSEMSLAQLWLVGTSSSSEIETLEAGWQVLPSLYGDYKPRLFIYWTEDSYKPGTGCYNLKCTGFVQTNNKIALGGSFASSVYGGNQLFITIIVWKDTGTGNWWLKVGQQVVGYWPASMFNLLSRYANRAEFGGEVAFQGTPHTSTDMGSGHFPQEGFGKAAFIKNIEVVNSANKLYSPTTMQVIADKPRCYGVSGFTGASWGKYIYFGGSGKNLNCP